MFIAPKVLLSSCRRRSLLKSFPRMCSTIPPINDFHLVADKAIESIVNHLGEVEDSIDDSDVSYSVRLYVLH